MKDKTKKIIFSVVSGLAIIGTSLGLGLGFGLPKKDLDGVSNTGDSSRTYVKELWDSSTKKFHKGSLNELYQTISGNPNATIYDINELAGSTLTSANIRANNDGYDATVLLGGFEWQIMYLSKDSDGNSIVTLWLSNCEQAPFAGRSSSEGAYYGFIKSSVSGNTGLYSDWSGDWATSTTSNGTAAFYPSAMYGTSYIRAVTLNNGGAYATSNTALTTVSKNANNAFASFTMPTEGENNDLTDFIVTPSKVSWQKDQSYKTTFGTSYNYPNEAWSSATSDTGFHSSAYNYAEHSNYAQWANDYLWLPSTTETGFNNTTYIGLWEASVAQRQNYDGSTNSISNVGTIGSVNVNGAPTTAYTYSWLRTGGLNDASYVYTLSPTGVELNGNNVRASQAVRPALHLNLTLADKKINDYEFAEVPSNMHQWTRYHSSVQISYNRESDTNTIAVASEPGWYEYMYYPLTVEKDTYYKIMFQYSMPAFSPLSDYSIYLGGVPFGVHSKIPTSAVDAYGNLGYDILYPSTSGQGEVYFYSGSFTTVYVLLNFCYVADGTTYTFTFSHINNLWQYSYDTDWEGEGTKDSPYHISSAEELAGIAHNVNNGVTYKGVYFKQTTHLNLGGLEWTPIGEQSTLYFSGIYDGTNYKISNMYINNQDFYNSVGLFGLVDGIVKNVNLENSTIISTSGYAGAITGVLAEGELENCHSNAIIESGYNVGGMTANCWKSTIKNCSFSGSIISTNNYAAGIAGQLTGEEAKIENSSFSGNVKSTGLCVAGIVAELNGGTISNCISKGTVRGNNGIGAIVGKAATGTIENCAGYGQLISTKSAPVSFAAIVGVVVTNVTIKNCSFIGGMNFKNDIFYGLDSDTASCNISGCYVIINENKYYSAGDFSGWTIMNNMNDGLPMQNNLYAIAIGGYTSEEVIANLKSKGFSLYS